MLAILTLAVNDLDLNCNHLYLYCYLLFFQGQVGDWKRYFTVADNECFDDIYREKMKDYPEFTAMIQMEETK